MKMCYPCGLRGTWFFHSPISASTAGYPFHFSTEFYAKVKFSLAALPEHV